MPVLVFYMALKHIDRIADHLMAAGRPADEPAAVVSRAATPAQRVLVGTLGDIAEGVRREGIEPPALVVVGKVVQLQHRLDWLANLTKT